LKVILQGSLLILVEVILNEKSACVELIRIAGQEESHQFKSAKNHADPNEFLGHAGDQLSY
jgi:hypothetical protein